MENNILKIEYIENWIEVRILYPIISGVFLVTLRQ